MDEITRNQDNWLKKLQSLSKRPLKVSKSVNGKPTKWVPLEECEYPVDYRTVLHNEVVIDIDAEHWKDVRMCGEIVTETLHTLGIPYIKAYSGGRGIHIHVFFGLSSTQKRLCEGTDVMPKDVRVFLFEYILRHADISPKLIGPGKTFDTACVNWSDEGKGHLIRVFGGKKQKYKTLLTDIPEERPKSNEVVFPEDVQVYAIPDSLFQEFLNSFKKFQKERVEAIQRYQKASQSFAGTFLNLPCVQKILEGLPEGQRNAGARILAISCRLDKKLKEDAFEIMRTYERKCPPENISESEYLGWVDWIYNQENLFWNCRFSKELGLCEGKCLFEESVYEKENEFLTDKNLVQKVSAILDKKIKKEEKNRLIVLFTYLSAYGSNPLNLFLKGESSTGKSYLAKSVAEYFPPEDVWFIGDMSPKALIHEHGRSEQGKIHVSLEKKILVFLESPRRETLEMLKPILSHDRREIEYKVADKSSQGTLQTKSVIIEGWPATVFCTADVRVLEELSTRSLLITPESSQEKIREVLEFKGSKYARPWEQMAEDREEKILKSALRLLREKREVCIPFADGLAERYTKVEPRVMRDFDKFMELIRMSAFLHQRQRPSFELVIDGEVQHFVIATESDYTLGEHLFSSIERATTTGLSQNTIDFYEKVVCQLDELTYVSLMRKYKEVYKKLIGRDVLRRKYVEPLETVGWLDREKDPEDGRRWVFENCGNGEDTGEIRNCAHLVFRDIFPESRLKEYVESVEKECAKREGGSIVVEGRRVEVDQEYGWFYGNCAYFSEQANEGKGGLEEETGSKSENRTNTHNSGEEEFECGTLKGNLIESYDEETVLSQISQEDMMVEDVVKKFKDQNRVVDTLVNLRDKKKIMVGQGYVRRLGGTAEAGRSGARSVNRWTCGECGIEFFAHEPFRNYEDHAICEDCWKKLDS